MGILVALGLLLILIVVGFLCFGGLDYLLRKWSYQKTTEEDDPRDSEKEGL